MRSSSCHPFLRLGGRIGDLTVAWPELRRVRTPRVTSRPRPFEARSLLGPCRRVLDPRRRPDAAHPAPPGHRGNVGGRTCVPHRALAHVRRRRRVPGAAAHHRAAGRTRRVRQPATGRAARGPDRAPAQERRRPGLDGDRRHRVARGAGAPVSRACKHAPGRAAAVLVDRRLLSSTFRRPQRRPARRRVARVRDGRRLVREKLARHRGSDRRRGVRAQVLPRSDDHRPPTCASHSVRVGAWRGAHRGDRGQLHPARCRRRGLLLPACSAAIARLAQPRLRL